MNQQIKIEKSVDSNRKYTFGEVGDNAGIYKTANRGNYKNYYFCSNGEGDIVIFRAHLNNFYLLSDEHGWYKEEFVLADDKLTFTVEN